MELTVSHTSIFTALVEEVVNYCIIRFFPIQTNNDSTNKTTFELAKSLKPWRHSS